MPSFNENRVSKVVYITTVVMVLRAVSAAFIKMF